MFGFSYKKNTSDTRSTPAAQIVAQLARGREVAVHDPQVTDSGFEFEMAAQGYSLGDENLSITFCGPDYSKAVEGAEAIVILTEWDQFKT